jgi:Mg-chelatase subunit ChlD
MIAPSLLDAALGAATRGALYAAGRDLLAAYLRQATGRACSIALAPGPAAIAITRDAAGGVSGAMLYLPDGPATERLDRAEARRITACWLHELGHALYTSDAADALVEPTVRRLWNAIEDAAIERSLIARFPGAEALLHALLRGMIAQPGGVAGLRQPGRDGDAWRAAIELRRLAGYPLPAMPALPAADAARMRALIAAATAAADTTAARVAVALAWAAESLPPAPPAPPADAGDADGDADADAGDAGDAGDADAGDADAGDADAGDAGDADAGDAGDAGDADAGDAGDADAGDNADADAGDADGDADAGDAGDADGDAGDAALDPDIAAALGRALGQHRTVSAADSAIRAAEAAATECGPTPMARDAAAAGLYATGLAAKRRQIDEMQRRIPARLAAELRQALAAPAQRGRIGRQFAGRLDPRALSRAATGLSADVFSRRWYRAGHATALHLAVDASGSMRGEAATAAVALARTLAAATAGLPAVSLGISAFPVGDVAPAGTVLAQGRRMDPAAAERLDVLAFADGNMTPTADAVANARRELAAAPPRRKLLVILTDGGPNVGLSGSPRSPLADARAEVAAAQAAGVRVLQIRVGGLDTDLGCPAVNVDPDNLAAASLAAVLEEIRE